LIRLGVVCLADLAVKKTTFKRRLLAMLKGEIIININESNINTKYQPPSNQQTQPLMD
jgi:hypothetical protein